MSESEFDIINTYFSHIGDSSDWLITGVGDDAAVIATNPEQQLLIAIDTLNAGVHFPDTTPADEIGYKALAVNVSDIAAMGGQPIWFTLSLSLPEVNHEWLRGFAAGLSAMASEYNLTLIGGDTTRGPLSATIQIAGIVPKGKALCRSGANIGDDIYVTGTLGDAAAGLNLLQQHLSSYSSNQKALINRLHHPVPRVGVGLALRDVAGACIDVSDGLAADLGHILVASKVGAEINPQSIPLSEGMQHSGLAIDSQYELALHGGDDYELCFTAAETSKAEIKAISQQTGCRITCIGKIIEETGLFSAEKQQRKAITKTGFDHFIPS